MSYKPLTKVNWGIIGVGDVCEVKSAPAMNLIKGSKLVAVMRRNEEKAKDYAERHSVPKFYSQAKELIEDQEVNAIYIATPPDSHKTYTLQAAAAGKPVYVEKPMARNHQECTDMINACQQAEVPLFVAYYRRMLPNFLKVQSLLKENAIGDVRLVNIKLYKSLDPSDGPDNWRILPEIAGGGYFYDLASHQLDLLDYLFGPIIEARGFAGNQAGKYPAEDIVAGSFNFKNGIIGQGTWCFTTSENLEEELTTIVGSKGQISFSCFGDPSVILEVNGNKKEVFHFEMPKHIQQPLIQTVVDNLLGNSTCPSSGISGARTNKVMELLCPPSSSATSL